MLYQQLLREQTRCPFCFLKEGRVLVRNQHAYLTYAIAPYHAHHMLVIPHRHVVDFTELTHEEWSDMQELIVSGTNALKKMGYTSCSVLTRNGDATDKSVDHNHFHVVPDVRLGDLDSKGEERRILSEEEIASLVEELKALL